MIDRGIDFVQSILANAGFFDVFLAAIVEEVAFLIPSSLVQFGAGFFVMGEAAQTPAAFLRLVTDVAVPIALGTIVGSLFLYGLSYWLGKPFVDRFGRWFGITWSQVEAVEARMEGTRKDEALLFLARLIPIIPAAPIAVACGLVRYPVWRYALVSLVGVFLRSMLVGYLGWQAGSAYEQHAATVSKYEDWVLWGLAALVAGALVWALMKARKYV
jgi:membrane protein DedA with SNARE-associated domain